ncbi:ABC transporter permease [Frankia sp. CiP3]|uniref:ABC transporter permease n=1 Tax=Frankia sp. CiP3 TaxID=2880971 RepID=UPI001EF5F770|nr:ABC transporter permease [Frankia sp. CiP3]
MSDNVLALLHGGVPRAHHEDSSAAGRYRSIKLGLTGGSHNGPPWYGRRAGTALIDVYLLTKRILMRLPRQPDIIAYSIIQPALFTLAMVYLFSNAIHLPGGGSYTEFVIGGLLAQTVVFTAASTSGAVAIEIDENTIDRLRTLPVARSTVLAGFTNAGLIKTFMTVLVTISCGFTVGWRIHAGIASAFVAIFLLLFFGLAMSWVGALIGVTASSPEAAAGAGTIWLFPVIYLSNALAPVQSMPVWVQYIAEWNPVSAIATACRQLFGNPAIPVVHHTWMTEYPITMSFVWSLSIMLIAVPLSVRKFMRATSR